MARDVGNDKVSLAAARDQYGVVFDESLTVDREATAALRAQRAAKST